MAKALASRNFYRHNLTHFDERVLFGPHYNTINYLFILFMGLKGQVHRKS